ncbi:MAG: hypothetical protein QY305_12815 [Candidatus Brocadiaceae baterium WH-1]|nr:MAG: hypothetical protein QY305_12815 [Candidatus Jettenia sp. AMX2]
MKKELRHIAKILRKRPTDNEVLKNTQGVWEVIRKALVNLSTHPPLTPPIEGGEFIKLMHLEKHAKKNKKLMDCSTDSKKRCVINYAE